MFEVQYLPIAQTDLLDIVDYMTLRLYAPIAASDFVRALDKTVETICAQPYFFPLYHGQRMLHSEVRFVPVKNYVLYYVVKENVVEVQRIIFGKRNRENMI
ncbi:MAG: type II toxin-antitoxin system RelE/ParE family toxin [Ruthenibacterium sp.]